MRLGVLCGFAVSAAPPSPIFLKNLEHRECRLAAILAESLGLSGAVQELCGYATRGGAFNFDTATRKASGFPVLSRSFCVYAATRMRLGRHFCGKPLAFRYCSETCGYAAAEAKPLTTGAPPGKPEAFRKDSGEAANPSQSIRLSI